MSNKFTLYYKLNEYTLSGSTGEMHSIFYPKSIPDRLKLVKGSDLSLANDLCQHFTDIGPTYANNIPKGQQTPESYLKQYMYYSYRQGRDNKYN